ncbi:MAG: GNAT family N-acetyltransferase [Magnetococcales bacterium]|nr:GNAT family N-acetyltransferase [Magnetococcales bacterium]
MNHTGNTVDSLDITVVREDMDRVRDLVASTGNFNDSEVDMAVELVETRLSIGDKSGYFFLFAREPSGRLSGYACYGPIAATDSRYDFYWLVVRPQWFGSGLGVRLQTEAERLMRLAGAKRIYLETSSTPAYQRARGFYRKTGYEELCVLKDFYRDDDDKHIFMKVIVK